MIRNGGRINLLTVLSLVILIDCLLLRLGLWVHSLFGLSLSCCRLLLALSWLLGRGLHSAPVADAKARLHWHYASIGIINRLLIFLTESRAIRLLTLCLWTIYFSFFNGVLVILIAEVLLLLFTY